nr:unnamed protein product [Digitaria exilis]
MSLGSRRKTSSVMSASATATFAANTGFRGSLRANSHISAPAAPTASAAIRSRAPTPVAAPSSTPHAAYSPPPPGPAPGTPQSNESSGSRAARWSSVDRSVPSFGGSGGRPAGSGPIGEIARARGRRFFSGLAAHAARG